MKNSRYFLLSLSLFALFSGAGDFQIFAQDPNGNPQIAKNVRSAEKVEQNTADAEEKQTDSSYSTKRSFAANPLARIGVQTDQTLSLSLNDAIKTALENNNDIEVSRDEVRFQETRLRSLLGIYDGVFTISPTFTRNSITGSTATNDFRANADFSKLVTRGGGNYRVFFNNQRTENAFAQAQVSSGASLGTNTSGAIYSSSTGFSFTQPLWRDFKIDTNRRQIRIQRKVLQQTDADFRRQTIETISQVQQAYWDLVFALRDQQNRVANLNLAKENLRQVEARIEAGAAAPLERAEVATELANRESDVLTATEQVTRFENNLKRLLIRNPESPQWSQSVVPTDQPVFSQDPINLDDALKDAVANRPELSRLRLQKEINEIDVQFFKNQTRPQIDLNTSLSFDGLARGGTNNGFVTQQFVGNDEILRQRLNLLLPSNQQISNTPIVIPPQPGFLFGNFNQSLRNIFRSDAPNFSVGVTISFPFRNKTAEADLAGARIQQEQIAARTRVQEQTIISEVRNAVQAVETARQRVFTSRRARENAEIQLEGERRRYEVGLSTTFLLFQRENALTNARNAEIRAETDYNKALSELQRATSTTFRVNNIEIESPNANQK